MSEDRQRQWVVVSFKSGKLPMLELVTERKDQADLMARACGNLGVEARVYFHEITYPGLTVEEALAGKYYAMGTGEKS